jgi:hypothetical protein
MTKDEAKDILSKNVLRLDIDDIAELPIGIVEIDGFNITNEHIDFPVKLLGLIPLYNKGENNADLRCYSYFVSLGDTYYYRYSFLAAFKVIEALRVLNDYHFETDPKVKDRYSFYYR